MLRRLSVLLLAGLGLFLGPMGTASAAPPVSNTNEHQKNLVETFVDVIPTCDAPGELYVITITSNFHLKETVFANGNVHATFTQNGKVSAVPEDGTGPSYTGNFAQWGNFNQNNKTTNGTFTFHVNLTGSDGSKVHHHENDHFNVRPDGSVREFFKCH
jgi:hypothetical protein